LGTTTPQAIGAANVAAAVALWTERVGQGRKWDHKVALAEMYDGVVILMSDAEVAQQGCRKSPKMTAHTPKIKPVASIQEV
jgi:hypothetical protein